MDATTSNFRVVSVTRWTDVTPRMRRITLAGNDISHFATGGLHTRVLFPESNDPQWPTTTMDGRLRWLPGQKKMASRAYTIRCARPEVNEVDIDFVLHGDEGIASGWAARVKPGDKLGIMGPIGRIIPAADYYVLVGDETALSPIGRILENLPESAQGVAILEVADAAEEQALRRPSGVKVQWLHRNDVHAGESELLREAAIAEAVAGKTNVFCWLGAERSTFQQVRDHWRDKCGIGMTRLLAVPYWRIGSEQFKDETVNPATIEYMDPIDPDRLSADWQAFSGAAAGADNAHRAQGATELHVVAAGVSQGAVRLDNDWEDIIGSLPAIGRVTVTTSTASAIHRKSGQFDRIMWDDERPVVLDDNINLRIRLDNWAHAFAIEGEASNQARRGLRFFDAYGEAVLAVDFDPSADNDAFRDLVSSHRHADQSRNVQVRKPALSPPAKADAEIDTRGLLSDWRSMLDTHDIFALARRYGATRVQAFRLVPDEFARETDRSRFFELLKAASADQEEVMIFVSSPGNVQIHIGTLDTVERQPSYIQVTGPEFALTVLEQSIASCWVINKPTVDGNVTSLEIFDSRGEQIAWIFGKRKPGNPQAASWRTLVEKIAAR